MEPWRPSVSGISISLRVTPRGGRDAIDGIESLADGRAVLKLRVRAIADGGEANRAVIKLLAKTVGVAQGAVRIAAGAAARIKQVEISGEPRALAQALMAACNGVTGKRKDHAT
jgi:uncharacterized protein